jgi:AbrB family looped-hinge helix DNA binding protein
MLEFKGGQCICGTVTVGERGQIVIPKKAREYFNIQPGDNLVVLGDKNKGITIFKAEDLEEFANFILNNVKDK